MGVIASYMWSYVLAAVFGMALFATPARAVPPAFDLRTLTDHANVVPSAEWLEDADRQLSLQDVMALPAARFRAGTGAALNFGYVRSAFWLRFEVANSSRELDEWLLEVGYPHFHEVDLYAVHADGKIDHVRAGNRLPFGQRAVAYPQFAFPQKTPAGETTRYFLRMKSEGAALAQLSVWRKDAFMNHLVNRNLWLWLLWGGIALMAAFNGGVAVLLRNPEYVHGALILLAQGFVVFTLSGETFQYLAPNYPELASHFHATSYLLLALAIQYYGRAVMGRLENPPHSLQLLRITIPISLVVLACSVLGPMWIMVRCGLVFSSAMALFALYVLRTLRPYPEMRFHLLGSYLLFLSLPIAVVAYANLVTPHPLMFVAANVGVGLYAVFTSLALPQNIREMGNRLARLNTQLQTNVLELESALARAEQGQRAKDQFLANMSHELRTPLNAIINVPQGLLQEFDALPAARCVKCGAVYLLDAGDTVESLVCEECQGALKTHDSLRYRGSPERSVRFLQKIERSGKHLLQMVNDVLDASKMAAGRFDLEPGELSLGALIADTADEMSELAARKQVRIELELPAGAEPAHGDSVRLKQVLLNLLSNAIKFSEPDSRVLVRWHQSATEDLVSVIDQGIGIASEHHERIFSSFEQVHGGNRKYGGTGLGLSISRELVRLHGGELWVDSAEGSGSTFTFRIPRAQRARQQPAA